MLTPPTATAPITVPFVCPACAGPNRVHLVSLSRAGGMDCEACGRWLRSGDVMRAMHAPRTGRDAASAPIRAHEPRRVAVLTAEGTHPGPGARALPSRRDRIVWPPTAETRAAANRAHDAL